MAKNYIGSQLIREYEADIASGVSKDAVTRHAELKIKQFRRIDTFAANTAADQLDDWLNALANG
jgi:hypothetical protein